MLNKKRNQKEAERFFRKVLDNDHAVATIEGDESMHMIRKG
jgi:transposase-like protein